MIRVMKKWTEIPVVGNFPLNQFVSHKGKCLACGTSESLLRRHFLRKHKDRIIEGVPAMEVTTVEIPAKYRGVSPTGLLLAIPRNREVTPEEIYCGKGFCQICGLEKGKLRDHFKFHLKEEPKPHGKAGTWEVKVIPADGSVKIADVYGGMEGGRCDICIKDIKGSLRQHLITVHLKQTRRCETCNVDVISRSYTSHMESHSGPTQCLICDVRSDSIRGVKSHIWRYHKSHPISSYRLLIGDEITAYEQKRADERLRTEARLAGRESIKDFKKVLAEYETRLDIPGDDLYERKEILKQELNALLVLTEDECIKYNASFSSIWDQQRMLPKLVFEIVERTSDFKIMESTSFYPDPKLQHIQPTIKDFAYSGYHRGHLCAAGNYHENFLVACTYYYDNVVAMFPDFNTVVRQMLEATLREMAQDDGRVTVFHLPFIDGAVTYTKAGSNVPVPSSVGTVAIVDKADGMHIYGWEVWNVNAFQDLGECERDPFGLFLKAGLNFKLDPSAFVYISQDMQ